MIEGKERKLIDYRLLLRMISDKPAKHIEAYQDLCRYHQPEEVYVNKGNNIQKEA